jgi:tellurite resistance protein
MSTRKEGLHWLFNKKCGFKEIPGLPAFDSYLKAILICANGDNELTQAERDWVIGHGSAFNAPDQVIEELKTYQADEDIDAVISRDTAANACRRYLVYDAIEACSADGEYSNRERETVTKMAAKLGVDAEIVKQIEEIYTQEAKLREKRLSLLFPTGTPL